MIELFALNPIESRRLRTSLKRFLLLLIRPSFEQGNLNHNSRLWVTVSEESRMKQHVTGLVSYNQTEVVFGVYAARFNEAVMKFFVDRSASFCG